MATNKKAARKKSLSPTQKVGIGVGLTTAAVAAAGAYFLYGSKNASQNRKLVKSWMLKAKADVLERLEQAENMTEAEFMKIVDTVAAGYSKVKGATKTDIAAFKREMKEHWPKIVKEGSLIAASVAAHKQMKDGATKKAAKKSSAKKTTKKAAKKSSSKKSS